MAKKINNKPVVNTAPKPAPVKAEPKKPQAPRKKLSPVATLCLILAAVSLLAYANTLRNGYVLDDSVVTIKNSIVMQGFKGIPELLATPRMKGVGYFKNDNYRPLSLSMFAAEKEIFGSTPIAGHFFNIVFFAGCVVLLFLFLDKLFERKKTMVAFIAALLFALHPIHTEVVANIKSRDEIMCFFFAFLAANLFTNYMQKGSILQLLLGVVSLFLSFISKETVIIFVALMPMVFFFYRNESRQRAIFITAGTLISAAAFLIIRHFVLTAYGCSTTAIEFIDNDLVRAPNAAMRIGTAILILGKYIQLLFVPYPLINDYCFNSIPYVGFGNIWVLLTTITYLGLAGFAVYRFLKVPKDPWAFSIIFFLASLVLFSNIPFLIGSKMGERFVFFASVGFCLAVALAIEKWWMMGEIALETFSTNKRLWIVLVPVCLVFTSMTIARNNDWKDNYTLFKTDIEKQPNDARLYFYLGDELTENVYPAEQDTNKKKQILLEATINLKKCLAIFPDFPDAHTEAGNTYLYAAKYDSAKYHFIQAITLSPYQSIAANNLGTVYLRTGNPAEAIKAYELSLTINPGFAQAFYNLGGAFIEAKQTDSAIYYLNRALSIDPNYVDAYQKIGLAYFQDKKFDLAEPYFRKATELNPADINAINNLGANYLNAGRLPQALEQFKKTVTLNPNYFNGYSNMGHVYYQMKQYQATIDNITKAISLNQQDVNDIPYIALSYKGLGNMAEAHKYEAIAQKYYPLFKLE